MKKNGLLRAKRIIAAIIAFVLVVSVPSVSVFAATIDPYFYATAYSDVVKVYGEDATALQSHYDKHGEAEGRSATVEDAIQKRDIRSLLLYFLSKNADYYRENALKPGFMFFNAENYLKENSDVAAAIGNNKAAALEHYLTYGALEGRGCGTTFDPVIAITVMPKEVLYSIDEIVSAWTKVEGKASTKDYTLHVNFKQKGSLIYTATKSVNVGNNSVDSESENLGTDNNVGFNHNDGPKPAPISNKTFTLLAYVCGSDLESREGIMEGTKAILKVLLGSYYADNTNVLILAGGADKWKNEYLQNLLGGRAADGCNKSAIFTVNVEKLKAKIRDYLAKDDACNSVDDIYNVIDTYDKQGTNGGLFQTLVADLINEETLSVYGDSLGSNKMGDASTLESLLTVGTSGKYKADSYALSLWNHGGGSLEGVCFPDDETGGLTIPEIKKALDNTGFGATGSSKENKLALLAFDACLMSGVETAAYLSDSYDMMYASEETSYGDIDYYHLLKIANQTVGKADLSMELAKVVFMDRSENYLGTDYSLATGALFKSGMAAESIRMFNTLAGILNIKAANNANIYAAIKNARLKCEQFDAMHGSFDNGKEYVDIKNFLQMLKSELKDYEITDATDPDIIQAIDNTIKAADIATYANAYNYGKNRVFYNFNGSDVYVNEAFWNQIKGMDLCGANVFVPYYSKDKSTVNDYLAAYNTNYAGSLSMENYNTLVNNYVMYLDADKDRVANLTKSLIDGCEMVYGEKKEVTGYADLIDMSLKNAADREYLSIVIKNYAEEEMVQSQFSSGDAFVDLCETMDSMLVYITRKARAMCKISGEQTTDYYVDIVVGSKTIYYENLNGLESAVNIFTDQINEAEMNIVKDQNYTWNEIIKDYDFSETYDFITPSDIEGYLEKDAMVAKIMEATGKTKDYVAQNWMTAKGTAKNDKYRNGIPVYHVFEKEGDNYSYRGSVILQKKDDTAGESGTTAYEVGDVVNAKSITFYHQTVDPSTNKLVYAEEYSWTDADDNNINITSLYGAKEHRVGETASLTISGVELKNIGSADENRYYFAVSQNENTNDDDVFANVSAKGNGYNETPSKDVFDVVDTAMSKPVEDSEDTNPECKISADATEMQSELEEDEDETNQEEINSEDTIVAENDVDTLDDDEITD